MTRIMDTAQSTGLQQKRISAVFMARIEFPTTPLFAHNGVGSIVFNGDTYIGVGDNGLIEVVEENLASRPADVRLMLLNIPQTVIDPVINEPYHGCDLFIYYTVCNDFGQPVATPFEMWRGTVDTIELIERPNGIVYVLEGKNILSLWNRSKTRHITDAELQRRFPGDTARKHLATIATKQVFWGPQPIPGYGRGGGDRRGGRPEGVRPV